MKDKVCVRYIEEGLDRFLFSAFPVEFAMAQNHMGTYDIDIEPGEGEETWTIDTQLPRVSVEAILEAIRLMIMNGDHEIDIPSLMETLDPPRNKPTPQEVAELVSSERSEAARELQSMLDPDQVLLEGDGIVLITNRAMLGKISPGVMKTLSERAKPVFANMTRETQLARENFSRALRGDEPFDPKTTLADFEKAYPALCPDGPLPEDPTDEELSQEEDSDVGLDITGLVAGDEREEEWSHWEHEEELRLRQAQEQQDERMRNERGPQPMKDPDSLDAKTIAKDAESDLYEGEERDADAEAQAERESEWNRQREAERGYHQDNQD